jgi:hypothetical protein
MSGSSDWTPRLMRLTPARSQVSALAAVVLDGLASMLISASPLIAKQARTSSRMPVSSAVSSRLGVPPPTKMVSRWTPLGSSAWAMVRSSVRSAAAYSRWPRTPPTEVKSQ